MDPLSIPAHRWIKTRKPWQTRGRLQYWTAPNNVRGDKGHFFDRKSMQFFGDRMSNFGVRAVVVASNYDEAGNYCPDGAPREVWELYRKRPVKHGLQGSHYFSRATFQTVYTKKD